MTIVKEVADLLHFVAEGIQNIREIWEAAGDGYKLLKRDHPAAQADLAGLLGELRGLLQTFAEASSAVTHFDFIVTGSAVALSLDSFNKLYEDHKGVETRLEAQLDTTEGACHKIRVHWENIQMARPGRSAADLLGDLFGVADSDEKRKRYREVADLLDKVYTADSKILEKFGMMKLALKKAFEDVQMALRNPEKGGYREENVPEAARVLAAHAANFSQIEAQAVFDAYQLRNLIREIRS